MDIGLSYVADPCLLQLRGLEYVYEGTHIQKKPTDERPFYSLPSVEYVDKLHEGTMKEVVYSPDKQKQRQK